jgi:hypothetical protein
LKVLNGLYEAPLLRKFSAQSDHRLRIVRTCVKDAPKVIRCFYGSAQLAVCHSEVVDGDDIARIKFESTGVRFNRQ